ncbi:MULTISPECIES: type III secretion system protein [Erwinia]|uniref:Type III secretion system protein n=1 Tax=Erwinia papayae TaxID=206499 RepID=A0ABV3N3X0_9GAMM|nr:type III secretion system protein [Erwinia mallotivora]
MNQPEYLLRIMYCPSDYTDSHHLAEAQMTADIWNDTLLNYWLITHYQLEDLPEGWTACDVITSLILNNWYSLPKIVHLLGGYLLRERLMKQSAMMLSDERLLAFISLPLAHQVVVGSADPDITTMACGTAFLMSISTRLPEALRQRMILCLPPFKTPPVCIATPGPDQINLLKMSVNYAKN